MSQRMEGDVHRLGRLGSERRCRWNDLRNRTLAHHRASGRPGHREPQSKAPAPAAASKDGVQDLGAHAAERALRRLGGVLSTVHSCPRLAPVGTCQTRPRSRASAAASVRDETPSFVSRAET